jgi:hypothetical protein
MYNRDLVIEIIEQILTAANRIERRFADITNPDDFLVSEEGIAQE